MNKLVNVNLPIMGRDIESIPEIDLDAKKYMQIGWWIIFGGLGSFILWASLAPLDKGVPLSGTVTVASNKKAIQHEFGGTVDQIMVKDGDLVKSGDVLIRMNGVQFGSDAETARVQYIVARATQARLEAERDGRSMIMPSEFVKDKNDQRITESMADQKRILNARQGAFYSELSSIDQNISGLVSQIESQKDSVESKRQQKNLLLEQIKGVSELADEGYIASNRVLEFKQEVSRIDADISSDMATIARARAQVSELRLKKIQRKEENQREIRTELTEAQKQADSLSNQLLGLDRKVDNINIKSPVTGTVVGLAVFTKGAVVSPGFKLMDIVPKEDSLVVEGMLPVHLVDKVYPGLPVELMFTAFNQNKTPHIPGELVNVSADRFVDEKSGQPYYKVLTKVTPEGSKLLYNSNVKSGMPVDMFVKTGERTMMNYLLRPIIDHIKLSMSEE